MAAIAVSGCRKCGRYISNGTATAAKATRVTSIASTLVRITVPANTPTESANTELAMRTTPVRSNNGVVSGFRLGISRMPSTRISGAKAHEITTLRAAAATTVATASAATLATNQRVRVTPLTHTN